MNKTLNNKKTAKNRVYNHLQLVSKINVGCDYMFFKKDVPPMWEDPANSDGGVWKLNLDKKYHNSCLDTYWLNIVSFFPTFSPLIVL